MRWGIQITQKVFQPGREKIHLGVGFSTEENCGGPVECEVRETRRIPNKTLRTLPVIREKKHRKKSHPTLLIPNRRKTIAVDWQIWSFYITDEEGTRGCGTTGSVKSGAKIRRRSRSSIIPKSSKWEISTLSRKTFGQQLLRKWKLLLSSTPHLRNRNDEENQ